MRVPAVFSDEKRENRVGELGARVAGLRVVEGGGKVKVGLGPRDIGYPVRDICDGCGRSFVQPGQRWNARYRAGEAQLCRSCESLARIGLVCRRVEGRSIIERVRV